jgi:hypothetical protein
VISEPKHAVYNGQTVEVWPRIVWSPSWAITFAEVCEKLSRPMCISQRSTLVLNGKHITLEDISLDGTILVHSIPKAQVSWVKQGSCVLKLAILHTFLQEFVPSSQLSTEGKALLTTIREVENGEGETWLMPHESRGSSW